VRDRVTQSRDLVAGFGNGAVGSAGANTGCSSAGGSTASVVASARIESSSTSSVPRDVRVMRILIGM
jgi:hypothetical protein